MWSTTAFLLIILLTSVQPIKGAEQTGELKKWHKIMLTFDGPQTSEMDKINPFMNYRLDVYFTHKDSGKTFKIPGYFAADGNAAETSATSGNKWRVHFAPNQEGTWNYKVDFRVGNWQAVSELKNAGVSAGFMDFIQLIFLIFIVGFSQLKATDSNPQFIRSTPIRF